MSLMRRLLTLALGLCAALGTAPAALAQAEAPQALVDRATLAVQEMFLEGGDRIRDATALLRRARATVICPRLFRAGFIFGGEGGDCLLMARDGAGSWSAPAFYTLGGGSVGFQVGVQDRKSTRLNSS